MVCVFMVYVFRCCVQVLCFQVLYVQVLCFQVLFSGVVFRCCMFRCCMFTCCTSWRAASSFLPTGILWAGSHSGNLLRSPTFAIFLGGGVPVMEPEELVMFFFSLRFRFSSYQRLKMFHWQRKCRNVHVQRLRTFRILTLLRSNWFSSQNRPITGSACAEGWFIDTYINKLVVWSLSNNMKAWRAQNNSPSFKRWFRVWLQTRSRSEKTSQNSNSMLRSSRVHFESLNCWAFLQLPGAFPSSPSRTHHMSQVCWKFLDLFKLFDLFWVQVLLQLPGRLLIGQTAPLYQVMCHLLQEPTPSVYMCEGGRCLCRKHALREGVS